METIAIWVPVLGGLVTLFTAVGAWYINRRKMGGDIQLVTAETYHKLVSSMETQDERLSKLRDEIDELRGRVQALEDEANSLTERLRVMERYMRRLIGQLRAAGIKPDLPQQVMDDLFSGSGSGTGV